MRIIITSIFIIVALSLTGCAGSMPLNQAIPNKSRVAVLSIVGDDVKVASKTGYVMSTGPTSTISIPHLQADQKIQQMIQQRLGSSYELIPIHVPKNSPLRSDAFKKHYAWFFTVPQGYVPEIQHLIADKHVDYIILVTTRHMPNNYSDSRGIGVDCLYNSNSKPVKAYLLYGGLSLNVIDARTLKHLSGYGSLTLLDTYRKLKNIPYPDPTHVCANKIGEPMPAAFYAIMTKTVNGLIYDLAIASQS